jgi:hypothetical protein
VNAKGEKYDIIAPRSEWWVMNLKIVYVDFNFFAKYNRWLHNTSKWPGIDTTCRERNMSARINHFGNECSVQGAEQWAYKEQMFTRQASGAQACRKRTRVRNYRAATFREVHIYIRLVRG